MARTRRRQRRAARRRSGRPSTRVAGPAVSRGRPIAEAPFRPTHKGRPVLQGTAVTARCPATRTKGHAAARARLAEAAAATRGASRRGAPQTGRSTRIAQSVHAPHAAARKLAGACAPPSRLDALSGEHASARLTRTTTAEPDDMGNRPARQPGRSQVPVARLAGRVQTRAVNRPGIGWRPVSRHRGVIRSFIYLFKHIPMPLAGGRDPIGELTPARGSERGTDRVCGAAAAVAGGRRAAMPSTGVGPPNRRAGVEFFNGVRELLPYPSPLG